MTDTRFSAAIHTLVLISESESVMTSEDIARSVGANASYIRKLTAQFARDGIIAGRPGVGGFKLLIDPAQLTFFHIYQAIYQQDEVHLFDLHQNPNDACIVGAHIKPVLHDTFRAIGEKAEQELRATTLAQCVDALRQAADQG